MRLPWYAGDYRRCGGRGSTTTSLAVGDRDGNIGGTWFVRRLGLCKVSASNFFTHSASSGYRGQPQRASRCSPKFAVPLVSPEHGIPLIKSLRCATSPVVMRTTAMRVMSRSPSWPSRGEWSIAFCCGVRSAAVSTAPGLELANSGTIWRFGGSADPVRCVALVRRGVFTNYNTCISNAVVRYQTNTATTYGDDVKPSHRRSNPRMDLCSSRNSCRRRRAYQSRRGCVESGSRESDRRDRLGQRTAVRRLSACR